VSSVLSRKPAASPAGELVTIDKGQHME
jgi:hypothetical protein